MAGEGEESRRSLGCFLPPATLPSLLATYANALTLTSTDVAYIVFEVNSFPRSARNGC